MHLFVCRRSKYGLPGLPRWLDLYCSAMRGFGSLQVHNLLLFGGTVPEWCAVCEPNHCYVDSAIKVAAEHRTVRTVSQHYCD